MPELPEVCAVVEGLQRGNLTGHCITEVTIGWPRTVGSVPEEFKYEVTGRRIADFRQYGKYIFMELNPTGTISVHLRMSGNLYGCSNETSRNGYERVIIHLENRQEIRFYDPRKFGRMLYHHDANEVISRLGVVPLGPEFTVTLLKGILAKRRRQLKPLLLDQSVISGLGNIYTDEALWRARIHPHRTSNTLTMKEVGNLHESIREVLLQGIASGGTRLGNGKSNFLVFHGGSMPGNQHNLKVFGRIGAPCPRCGRSIIRIIVAQRSTHICPACQILAGCER